MVLIYLITGSQDPVLNTVIYKALIMLIYEMDFKRHADFISIYANSLSLPYYPPL